MCSCLSPLVGGTSVFQATSSGGLAELRIREEPSAAAHRLLCPDLSWFGARIGKTALSRNGRQTPVVVGSSYLTLIIGTAGEV